MNTKKQRSVSFILAIMFFIISITGSVISSRNLIHAEELSNKSNTQIFRKKIPVEIDGKIFNVDVESNLPFNENYNYDKPILTSLYPKYPVGTKRYFNFYISREALGLTSSTAEVSCRVLSKATSKLLAKVIPGIGWLSIASTIGVWKMFTSGTNGLKIRVGVKYIEQYYNMGGYYVYAWDLFYARVTKY